MARTTVTATGGASSIGADARPARAQRCRVRTPLRARAVRHKGEESVLGQWRRVVRAVRAGYSAGGSVGGAGTGTALRPRPSLLQPGVLIRSSDQPKGPTIACHRLGKYLYLSSYLLCWKGVMQTHTLSLSSVQPCLLPSAGGCMPLHG